MVAVTVIVMIADKESFGTNATIFRVFFYQERGIVDAARIHRRR